MSTFHLSRWLRRKGSDRCRAVRAGAQASTPPRFDRLVYRDPLDLPEVGLEELYTCRTGVWIERPVGGYPAVYYPPFFHDRATTEGLANLNANLPEVRPAAFIAKLSDVVLTGTRGIIDRDGLYCFDESPATPADREFFTGCLDASEPHLHQWMGFERTAEPGGYRLASARPAIQLAGPVALLTSFEGANFGAFMFRSLPKVAQLARLDATLKVLAPLYSETLRQFLVAAGVGGERIIHHDLYRHSYAIEELYIPSLRNSYFWLDDESLAVFDRMRMMFGAPRGDRRVYVSRGEIRDHPRRMMNEPELIDALSRRGFEVAFPERLTAVEQIRLFSSARVVVAAAGSAVMNAVFCHPGTIFIDIESEPHWIHGHVRIFASRRLRYGVFEGAVQDRSGRPHLPFIVDVSRLMSRLDRILTGRDRLSPP